LQQASDQRGVIAIEAVGHYGLEGNAGFHRLDHQRQRNLRFAMETRVLLATCQAAFRSVRRHVQRIVALRIDPQRDDGDDAVVDFTYSAKVLARHIVGGVAVLAVASIVDDQDPIGITSCQWLSLQQLRRSGSNGIGIPVGFGQEKLELLHRAVCAWHSGSAPASAVSVLFWSRGASNPAR
jgi:hypothetical protein